MPRLYVERDDANSESATLVAWLVPDGQTVAPHQPVAVVETSKATVDLLAPASGVLRHGVQEGAEIDFGATLGWVLAPGESLPTAKEAGRATADDAPAPVEDLQPTRAAARLLEQAGIDPAAIGSHGFITERDVRAYLDRQRARTAPLRALEGIDLEGLSLPDGLTDADRGRLDPSFVSRLRADGEGFRHLPSEEKIAAYREQGAAIADGVQLGPGSLLIAPRLIIGRNSRIGPETFADCAEQLAIGSLSHFGPRLELRARRAVFGDNIHAGRGITIGGGGHRDPWAVFVAGDLTFFGDEVFINVCRPVLIGREVFLTMRSIVVTHNIGHSPLEGFENRFAPVVVEDRAQVGMGCTLYAGVRLGREAIVGSNSYVLTSVPAGKLALGVPARVVTEARRTISPARQREVARTLVAELAEWLEARGERVERRADGAGFRVEREGAAYEVLYAETRDGLPQADPASEKVFVLLEGCEDPPPEGLLLELIPRRARGEATTFGHSVREYFRKRGIRFEPGPWRYTGGWI